MAEERNLNLKTILTALALINVYVLGAKLEDFREKSFVVL
jgi:hypothetical protein